MMKIIDLFPTAIYKEKLERELSLEEKLFFSDMLVSTNLKVSQGNKSTINKNILDERPCKQLKEWFTYHLNQYIEEIICPEKKVQPYITISWLNLTESGGHHHIHTHANSYLSGVFYIETSEDDRIHFHNINQYHQTIKLTPRKFNLYNSSNWWLPSEKNVLYLFPSNLWHSVEPISFSNQKRISLSFNTFIRGEIGNESESTKLVLN